MCCGNTSATNDIGDQPSVGALRKRKQDFHRNRGCGPLLQLSQSLHKSSCRSAVPGANRGQEAAPTGRVRTSPAVNSRINLKYSFHPVKQVAKPAFIPGTMQLWGLLSLLESIAKTALDHLPPLSHGFFKISPRVSLRPTGPAQTTSEQPNQMESLPVAVLPYPRFQSAKTES